MTYIAATSTPPTTKVVDRRPEKRKPRVMRTKDQWKALVSGFESSSLNQADYCKQKEISSSGLHKWRKHFTKEQPSTDFIDISEPLSPQNALAATPRGDSSWQVELELGQGIVLRVWTA
jgi:hypothetical protein